MKACLTASGALANRIGLPVVSIRKVGVKALLPYDVIIFNGANLSPPDYETAIKDNVLFLAKLVDCIGDRKLVFISSMSSTLPTPYGISKNIGETLVKTVKHNAIIKFSTLFYEDYNRDGLSLLIRDAVKFKKITLIGEGIAKRDFLPIEEAATYIKDNVEVLSGEVTVASGVSSSFLSLAEKISLLTDAEILFKEGEESFVQEAFKKTISFDKSLDFYILRYIAKLKGDL